MMAKISNFETRFLRDVRARHIREQQPNKTDKEKISTSLHNQAAECREKPVFNVTGQINENEHSFRGEISKAIEMAPDNAWRDDRGNVQYETEDGSSVMAVSSFLVISHTITKEESEVKQINAKLAWEQKIGPRTTGGVFVGVWQVKAI